MSESAFIPSSDPPDRPVLSKKERREARRRAAREAAEQEEQEANEPEPEPVVCAWCGFSAVFDEDAPPKDTIACPACGILYTRVRQMLVEDGHEIPISGDADIARDAVHRRVASALDNLFALLNEQWEEARDAAERGGFR